jgi:hypothetical protein
VSSLEHWLDAIERRIKRAGGRAVDGDALFMEELRSMTDGELSRLARRHGLADLADQLEALQRPEAPQLEAAACEPEPVAVEGTRRGRDVHASTVDPLGTMGL